MADNGCTRYESIIIIEHMDAEHFPTYAPLHLLWQKQNGIPSPGVLFGSPPFVILLFGPMPTAISFGLMGLGNRDPAFTVSSRGRARWELWKIPAMYRMRSISSEYARPLGEKWQFAGMESAALHTPCATQGPQTQPNGEVQHYIAV